MQTIDYNNTFSGHPVLLVHYGELALKGGNRRSFEDRLVQNISGAIGRARVVKIQRLQGAISIELEKMCHLEEAVRSASRVFGVANVAPAVAIPSQYEEIEKGVELLVKGKSFESFAIRARRSDKRFPMTSMEMGRRLGAKVQEISGARVDLDAPATSFFVEVTGETTFLFCDRIEGVRGLPVGSAGKVACLISGGIDSPVAAWRMMKRGCLPCYIHFHSAPYTSQASVEKVIDLVEQLSAGIAGVELLLVPFGEVQQQLIAQTPSAHRVLLYRRFMMRIATLIARDHKAVALVTGEALSQVASQTLSNLATIEAAAGMPILRPLLGMDKQEIVDEAKKIGTFQTACEPHDDCCSFLMPPHPATHSTPQELHKIEAKLDVEGLVRMGYEATFSAPSR